MVATSAHHIVRVTVRVDVVSFHRDVDLTLPTSSTLGEVLPEIARFIELPEIHRPWQATTPAGTVLDMNTPLYRLRLRDGSIIALHPQEPPAPPVVRDAAESLAEAARGAAHLRGLDTAATAAGCAALGAAALALGGPVAALLVTAVPLLFFGVYARSQGLFLLGSLSAAAACGLWVAGPRGGWVSATDPALGVLAAAATAAVCVFLGAALSLVRATAAAACFTAAALAALAAAAVPWLGQPAPPAAVAVLGALLGVAAAPGVATRAAGLKIPRIPTAGEEFATSDGYQDDVDERAARASSVAAGVMLGAALIAVPALAALAWTGSWWAIALVVCVGGAVVLHASRQHYRVPRASLSAVALAAVVACGVAASRMEPAHPAAFVVAGLFGAAAASAVAWVPRVPDLEPTTVVWLERAESLALIAALPVAAHLAGIFDLVRGI